ncbi:MAG: hypothetical protein R3C68_04530 [Myxococcota bacterium]
MAGLGLSGISRGSAHLNSPRFYRTARPGFVVYLAIVIFLALAPTGNIAADPMVWARISPVGSWIIILGMWGAIFSSAVGSMLGAPRTLQALTDDHASPTSLLGKLAGRDGQEPVLGVIVSLVLALLAVFLGDLNAVARVVSMFFLTVYGAVNLVAALETLSGDATWRPRLRVPWFISLLGAIGCFAVMFLLNPTASIAAIATELGLWLLFARLERNADWGDMRRDLYEALIRWALIRLKQRPMTARNWRPHVLVFAEHIEHRLSLVRFGDWLSQGRGVVTVCELMIGDVQDEQLNPRQRRQEIDRVLGDEGIIAFAEVDVVPYIDRGIVEVVQANGLAGFESNTVLLGWPNDLVRLSEIMRVLRRLERLNKSVIIGKLEGLVSARQNRRPRIHIWWGGLQRNGDLMLLIAHLLTRNPAWRRAKIHVLSIASNELTKADTQAQLDKLLPEARIDAETHVMVKPKDVSVREIIHKHSGDADMVLLGLATPEPGNEQAYAERIGELAQGLPTVLFVKNATLFIGELVSN